MIVYASFFAGATTFVAWDWARHKVPRNTWGSYWTDHLGANLANGLMAFVAFVAWRAKILKDLLELVGVHTDSALLKVEISEPIAFVAGVVLSLVTMGISRKLWSASAEPEGK
jgi:hypothetical protein